MSKVYSETVNHCWACRNCEMRGSRSTNIHRFCHAANNRLIKVKEVNINSTFPEWCPLPEAEEKNAKG